MPKQRKEKEKVSKKENFQNTLKDKIPLTMDSK